MKPTEDPTFVVAAAALLVSRGAYTTAEASRQLPRKEVRCRAKQRAQQVHGGVEFQMLDVTS